MREAEQYGHQERTFGIELECGDIYLLELARFVWEIQGHDFSQWRDRGTSSKIQVYDRWNVTSDFTLHNSNGTQLMNSVINPETGEKETAKKGNKHLWQGAEIISSVHDLSRLREFEDRLGEILDFCHERGATFRADLRHTTHFHVGIADYEYDDVVRLLRWIRENQDWMEVQFIPNYNLRKKDEGSTQYPRKWLTTSIMKKIESAIEAEYDSGEQQLEALFEAYRTTPSGSVGEVRNYAWRKVINPGQWFKWKLEQEPTQKGIVYPPTVEFRLFPSSGDVDQLMQWLNWSIMVIDEVKNSMSPRSGEELWRGVAE